MSSSQWLHGFCRTLHRPLQLERRRAGRAPRSTRLRCEVLEERAVPAVGDLLLTINNPTPAAFDNFSISVAAVGNNVLIGALGDNTGGNDSGAAFLFDGATRALLQTFVNPT